MDYKKIAIISLIVVVVMAVVFRVTSIRTAIIGS
jgi:hypothetical protein